MQNPDKTCMACGRSIKGRADKKFCDDYCRNSYNNSINGDTTARMRTINNILRRNRRLLQDLLAASDEMTRCPRNRLLNAGFNFQYFTELYTTKKGSVYHFCYEYGYLPMEGDWVLVVKKKDMIAA
jgi:predicted nucleic acid-binding Zn ribbon protein